MTEIFYFVTGCGFGALAMIISVLVYHNFYVRFIDKTADIVEDRKTTGEENPWIRSGKQR